MTRIESYSSLSTLASCAQKYAYTYVDRIEPPGRSIPAHAGTAMHAGLRSLYVDGFQEGDGVSTRYWTLRRAQAALREAWGDLRVPLGDKFSYLNANFLALRLERYIEERRASPTILEEGTPLTGIVETEQVFQWPAEDGSLSSVRVVLDLPLLIDGKVWVVDHKCTTGWVNSHWALQFRIGNQQRLYAAYLQQEHGLNVAGALINAIYIGEKANDEAKAWTKRKSSPSMLIRLDFTQEQINESRTWIQGLEAQRDAHAASGLWPRNEKACDAYGGCEYLELCSAPSEMARKARMMSRFRRKEGA